MRIENDTADAYPPPPAPPARAEEEGRFVLLSQGN